MRKAGAIRGGNAVPRELDVVEVTTDHLGVPRGTRGTVVDNLGDGAFLLEVVDDSGQTIALPSVTARDVCIVAGDHVR